MSRPENSKTQQTLQLPMLDRMQLGSINTLTFQVESGQPMLQSLELAADLADGVDQLSERISEGINNNDLAYCAELRALSFLSGVAGSLIRSACYALRKEGCE